MSVIATRYGGMHTIEPDKVVSRSLALYGEWAEDELNLLKQIITPGSCVLDVGAFIGTHTIAFSKFVGDIGKVYAFEPRREIFTILAENIFINNRHNVSVFNIGLAETEHKLIIPKIDISQSVNFGALTLDCCLTPNLNTYEIMVSTIDNLDIERMALIKLDVEGMERKVLDGAVDSISRFKPAVFCECNSLVAGGELLEFCHQNKYKAFGFLSSAYNKNNFNGNSENVFGDAKEFSLLLVSDEGALKGIGRSTMDRLLPINNIEDLVLPLLNKPQYAYEVLANTATCGSLGVDFPSPMLSEKVVVLNDEIIALNKEVVTLKKEIARIKTTVSWQITKPLRVIWNSFSRLLPGCTKSY